MNVIYIGGYGRSGSTLLDLLLGQHSSVASCGELVHLNKHIMDNKECTCGKKALECTYWKEYSEYLINNDSKIKLDELHKAKAKSESFIAFLFFIVPFFKLTPYSQSLRALKFSENAIEYALAPSGASFRVDSSKSCRKAIARPLAIERINPEHLFFIHVIREPFAVAASLKKGSNKDLEAGIKSGGRMYMIKGLFSWCAANFVALVTRLKLGRKNSLIISYEDFIRSPKAEILKVSNTLELEFNEFNEFLNGTINQKELHMLSGNRMRKEKLIIHENKDINKSLSSLDKILIYLCGGWLYPFFKFR